MRRTIRLQRTLSVIVTDKVAVWLPVIFFFIACALELLIIYLLNDRYFVYTLDDPYIHLALAENIAKGHYGINLAEYSAPSSSIIWPFLLAPFSTLSIGHYVPIIINLFASLVTLLLFNKIIVASFYESEDTKDNLAIFIIVALLIPATNLIGLAFTGMEHSLQLFFATMVVFGIVRERQQKTVPWWLLAAVVCGPLVRYESLALSLPAVAYLAWRRHYSAFFLCGIALIATLTSFSIFLYSIDLGLLPSSVLSKSSPVSSGGSISAIVGNLKGNLTHRQGALLSVGLLLLLYASLNSRLKHEDRIIAGWATLAVILHLLVGRFAWFPRYEIYIWSAALLTLIYLYSDSLVRIVENEPIYKVLFLMFVFVGTTSVPCIYSLLTTPLASNNIYEQHYQMHRFVTEYYRAPVAVNDLGWVSYRNERYILDLWGLASKKALRYRRNMEETAWMNTLAKEHNVRLAMIYDFVFPEVPENWIPIGELHLGKKRITPADSIVTFYALDAETLGQARTLLFDYQKTLPRGVRFVFRN